jgi:hypothetical protein
MHHRFIIVPTLSTQASGTSAFGRRLYPRRAICVSPCQPTRCHRPVRTTRRLGPAHSSVSGVVFVGTRCRVAQMETVRGRAPSVARLRAGQAGQAPEAVGNGSKTQFVHSTNENCSLSVGFNAPRQMPRMTAKARAFRNGVLFVASVMPQLMSDFGKRLVRLETNLGGVTNAIYWCISIF